MATVRDLLARKRANGAPGVDAVVSIATSATVLEAAQLMNAHGIGGLLVFEGGRLAGIFTERDALRRILGVGVDPVTTTVGAVMTAPVLTVSPETPIEECRQLFTGRRIRHLPVVTADGLVGVITSGDLLAFEADEQRTTIEHLQDYVYYSR